MTLPITPHTDRNLILTGYAGPAQLSIARQTAERLGAMRFVNFERRLEESAEMPLDVLRATFGETRLRTLEAELIEEMVLYRGALILISAATLVRGDFLRRLAATGQVWCLVAALDAVLQRLHLALGARFHDPAERAIALGEIRREWAIRTAPLVRLIDTTHMNETEIVEYLAEAWRAEALLARG